MKRFKNILFIADPESDDRDAFKRTVMLAENNQAQVTVVSVLEAYPVGGSQFIKGVSMAGLRDALVDKRRLQLESLVSLARKKVQVSTKVLFGPSFLAVIREVLAFERDLVIKSVEGGGILDRIFGSNDMHILRKCPCPVWLIKHPTSDKYRKILAAVDFDPFDIKPTDADLNRRILELSMSLALSEFCELHVVHVWRAWGESGLRSGFERQSETDANAYVDEIYIEHQRLLDELVNESITNLGKDVMDYLEPKVHLEKGIAGDVIPELINTYKIDLVIMGTVGRTGIPGFLMGNTAETILSRIDCSVLAIKPEGFVTPVTIDN